MKGHIVRYCEIKKRTVAWEDKQKQKGRLLITGNCFARLEIQKTEEEKPKGVEIRIGRITKEEMAAEVVKECEETLWRTEKKMEMKKPEI